jgi:hypothetical protein
MMQTPIQSDTLGNEEIRVPEVSRIFILGNIKKPGSYPLRDASETTVMKMIAWPGASALTHPSRLTSCVAMTAPA